jgi:zinc protease
MNKVRLHQWLARQRRFEILKHMIDRLSRRQNSLLLFIIFALVSAPSSAQSRPDAIPAEPTREQLLNGLTVLYLHRPSDTNVLLRLRIHSGAAFDLADKGGMMALLGDALFPDPATTEYFSEQLNGKLEVSTNYDAINVSISGKASEFERIVDLLRSALVSTQLSAENVVKIRDFRLKQLNSQQSIATQADEAVSKRLFGPFPYGHPVSGTPESVARIERADLLLARERFLNADNADLVVEGPIDKARVMRTLHQLLGPWQKSDRAIPATFRSAAPPDSRILVLDRADAARAEVRLAVRGLARSDRDATTASLLALIVRDRWAASLPSISSAFARHEANLLPGMLVIGGSVPTESAAKAIAAAEQVLQAVAQSGPTADEFQRARQILLAESNRRLSTPESLADLWLDEDAYNLPPVNTQLNSISSLSAADVQRVAARLFRDAAAKVVVGRLDQLTQSFQDNVEVLKNKVETKAPSSTPAKKP